MVSHIHCLPRKAAEPESGRLAAFFGVLVVLTWVTAGTVARSHRFQDWMIVPKLEPSSEIDASCSAKTGQ